MTSIASMKHHTLTALLAALTLTGACIAHAPNKEAEEAAAMVALLNPPGATGASSISADESIPPTNLGVYDPDLIRTIWPMKVCWDFNRHPGNRTRVQRFVEDSWERYARINFTHWRGCGEIRRADLRIIWDERGDGEAGFSETRGADTILFNFNGVVQEEIEHMALHEFGHALGLQHEQLHGTNHNHSKCPKFQRGENDERPDLGTYTEWGAFDKYSIMSYCSNTWSLSSGDIRTIRHMYGSAQKMHYVNLDGWGSRDVLYQGIGSSRVTYAKVASRFGSTDDVLLHQWRGTDRFGLKRENWSADNKKLHFHRLNSDKRDDIVIQGLRDTQKSFILLSQDREEPDVDLDLESQYQNAIEITQSTLGLGKAQFSADNKILHFQDLDGAGMKDIVIQGRRAKQRSFLLYSPNIFGYSRAVDLSSTALVYRNASTNKLVAMQPENWSADHKILHFIDFEGDGKRDILIRGRDRHQRTFMFYSLGNGKFAIGQEWSAGALGGMQKENWSNDNKALFTGDFNGDGRPDLLLQGRDGNQKSFLILSKGWWGFANRIVVSDPGYAGMDKVHWAADRKALHVRDFNGDGHADVLLQGRNRHQRSFLLLGAERGFKQRIDLEAKIAGMPNERWSNDNKLLHIRDFNADGRMDLLLQGRDRHQHTFLVYGAADGFNQQSVRTLSSRAFGFEKANLSLDNKRLYFGRINKGKHLDIVIQGKSSSQRSFILYSSEPVEEELEPGVKPSQQQQQEPGRKWYQNEYGLATLSDGSVITGANKERWSGGLRRLYIEDWENDGDLDILLIAKNQARKSFRVVNNGDRLTAFKELGL